MTLWIFVIAFGLRNILEPFVAYGRPHGTGRPQLGTGLGTLVGMIAAFALSGVAVAVWLYLDAAPATLTTSMPSGISSSKRNTPAR